ncbi:glycosyltransferase family 1 protein [Saccharophagus sp. K07]|uniref:glycosyltransferase family 4 protein n=1 Tax=Saccharophagus sp. K07 TaxID=2283636 RepID=UPI001652713F|nr:glycosyltransferase family 4 protein [Saccharophagus sp. K07]MBC6903968.1 glycosyltransferase family 1 protein [Saccharophagus sp. K07]
MNRRLKVLLIIESCNPEWASVPLVGYNFYREILSIADVTLVTHSRNREALLKLHPDARIHFIEPGLWEGRYYRLICALSTYKGRIVWPIRHALQYPLYFFFDKTVAKAYANEVLEGKYDLVHSLTPMMPRYPVSISKACIKTPFVLGPVNGGVPFPEAFKALGRKEFSHFNFLRNLGALLIPGYSQTYKHAHVILAGSTYTRTWIINKFGRNEESVRLVYENAVASHFYRIGSSSEKNTSELRVLFVGRLVPYKGADMLLRAMADPRIKDRRIILDIVGDGPELGFLKSLAKQLNIADRVNFIGWIPQAETANYYRAADVFGFPSVREFGGAVVMEAMAAGLPCIVVDNGGIGEYVTEESGYKIAPLGPDYVINGLVAALQELCEKPEILAQKSQAAAKRAESFSWERKRDEVDEIYKSLCQ